MMCHGDMALLQTFHVEKQTSSEEKPNFSFETVCFFLVALVSHHVKLS